MEWGCTKCGVEIPQDREFCDECEARHFRKIGGVLYLPFAGLVLTIIGYFIETSSALNALAQNYSTLGPNQKSYIILSVLISAGQFLFAAIVLSFFLKKKKCLPKLYISLLISIIATMSLDAYLIYRLLPDIEIGNDILGPIFRNALTALIWIPYFITSVRVKRTFTR